MYVAIARKLLTDTVILLLKVDIYRNVYICIRYLEGIERYQGQLQKQKTNGKESDCRHQNNQLSVNLLSNKKMYPSNGVERMFF